MLGRNPEIDAVLLVLWHTRAIRSHYHLSTEFERNYYEPVIFALELADRARKAMAEAMDKNGLDPDDEGYDVNELGEVIWTPERRARDDLLKEIERKVFEEIASDPSVREKLALQFEHWVP